MSGSSRMAPLPATCLLAVLGLLLATGSAAAATVAWQSDVKGALAAARTQGRPVLLDFWADWCVPCKAMDRDFWSRPDIAAKAQRLALVRVDFGRNRKVAWKHKVNAIPAVIVLDPWGNPLARFVGFSTDTRQLELTLRLVPDDFSDVAPWMATLEEDDSDFAALRGLGEFYYQHKFPIVSSQYYERALESKTAKSDARARGDVLVSLGWDHLQLKDNKHAREDFSRALEVPGLERADVALLGLVVANLGLGQRAEAEKAFAELSARFPDSQATSQARERLLPSVATGQG